MKFIQLFSSYMITLIKALLPEREISYGMILFVINYNAFNNDGGLIHPYYKCKLVDYIYGHNDIIFKEWPHCGMVLY